MARNEKTVDVDLAGRCVPVRLRTNSRARRLILRVDGTTGGAVVTLPPFTSQAEALDLVRREQAWLLRRLERAPTFIPFADGVRVPLLGVDHTIRHLPERRGVVWLEDGFIMVAGQPAHLARRVDDWFRRQARERIQPMAQELAARLGERVGRVTVRDTRSRWGSCAANGNLSFSWRLVMAPAFVFDYVVAHEVAHLVERNHGPRFWARVADLVPEVERARAWLNHHGEELHRYGRG